MADGYLSSNARRLVAQVNKHADVLLAGMARSSGSGLWPIEILRRLLTKYWHYAKLCGT
jgi:hypothetical protein